MPRENFASLMKVSLAAVDWIRYGRGWSGHMMFSVAYLVSYISKFMTLLPGDVIATGTPAGVGMGMGMGIWE